MPHCALNPDDLSFLFFDLQQPLVARSRTSSPADIAAGAAALAEAAGPLGIPVLFSLVPVHGEGSQLLPPLAPHVTADNAFTRRVARPFMDQAFVAALEATGRRTLVISGYSTEAAVPFAASMRSMRAIGPSSRSTPVAGRPNEPKPPRSAGSSRRAAPSPPSSTSCCRARPIWTPTRARSCSRSSGG